MAEDSEADVDLEEGELVSSEEEEEEGDKNQDKGKCQSSSKEIEDTNKPVIPIPRNNLPTADQSHVSPVSDEDELFSDDEESAYYPQKVKRHSSHQTFQQDKGTHQSRWDSPKQNSPTKSRGPSIKHRPSSPDSDQSGDANESYLRNHRKRDRSESSDKDSESHVDDYDSSDRERKERKISRDTSRNSDHYASPGRKDQDKRKFHSSPSYGRYAKHDRDNSSVVSSSDGSHGQQHRSYGWSRHGGYGSSSYKQSPRHTRRGRGGYTHSRRFPSNVGIASNELHDLSSQVMLRKEQGLSLLPAPKEPQLSHVDLSAYPPAPEWYLKDIHIWENVQSRQESLPMTDSMIIPPGPVGQIPCLFPPVPSSTTPLTMPPPLPLVSGSHILGLPPLLPPPGLPPPGVMPPLFNQPILFGPQVLPEGRLSLSSGQTSGQESASPSSLSATPSQPEHTPSTEVEGTPLDSTLPFAQPFPSFFHPSLLVENQSSSLGKGERPAHLLLATDTTDPINSTRKLGRNTTPTTPSSLTISLPSADITQTNSQGVLTEKTPVDSMLLNPVSSGVPPSDELVVTTSDKLLVEAKGQICLETSCEGALSLTSQEKPVFASSEVKMEACVPEENSIPLKDTPSKSLLVDVLQVSSPSKQVLSSYAPLNLSQVFPPPAKAGLVSATSDSVSSLPTSSASLTIADLSLRDPENCPDSVKYNLRSQSTSDGPSSNQGTSDGPSSKQVTSDGPSSKQVTSDGSSSKQVTSDDPSSKPRRDSTASVTNVLPPSNIIDISDDEYDYDKYLDQLDDDEVPVNPTLTTTLPLTSLLQQGLPKIEGVVESEVSRDPFSEDFPLISSESVPVVPAVENHSLKKLIGQVDSSPPPIMTTKSTKRKETELTWKAKQRQRTLASVGKKESVAEKQIKPLCKYYLNGICKNGSSCLFRHEGTRNRKKEVCKFYLQDTCNKGQDCMFYHGDFPCKFFHVKSFCKNGNSCKFSHAPLNTETESLLYTVIDTVTPTSSMPYQTFYHSSPAISPAYSAVQIQETSNNGFQVKMFGSQKTEAETSLLISLPKPATDEKQLIISIPLARIMDSSQRFSSVPKRLGTSVTNAEQYMNESHGSENADGPHTPVPPLFPSQNSMSGSENNAKGPAQRKILLPTPPPHVRLTPDDRKRMEVMQHEYWEAPGVAGPPGHSLGGAMWRPPPNVRYHPPPPRHKQPYFRPVRPRSLPPRPPPPNHHWNQPPHHGPPQWHPTGPGMELGPGNITSRPGGMEPRQPGMEPKQQGMEPRQSGMEPRPGGVEHRPPGMEPGNFSNTGFGGNDTRPGGMDPRQPANDPRYAGQDPRRSSSLSSQGTPNWGPQSSRSDGHVPSFQSGPTYSGPSSLSPPFQQGMSPPFQQGMSPPQTISTNRPSPIWSNNELSEKASPIWRPGTEESGNSQSVWRSSPEHSPLYKGGMELNVNRRVDPRKKYSHLKIKAKGHNESLQQLRKESDSDKPVTGFKIPKLLKDSLGLDKPLDPLDLFGASELAGSQPYGEITIGNYTSPFSQHGDSGVVKNGLNGDNADGCREDKLDQLKVNESTSRTSPSAAHSDDLKLAQVPSYLAQIDLGLGTGTSDLKIESAFGSLSDTNRSPGEREDGKNEVQGSHARKLPSVFGFGV